MVLDRVAIVKRWNGMLRIVLLPREVASFPSVGHESGDAERRRLGSRVKAQLRPFRQQMQLAQSFAYDFLRFAVSSSGGRWSLSPEQLEALMNIDSHRIEKGLALPATRAGFGKDAVQRLARYTEEHRKRSLGPVSERAASALRAYLTYHDDICLSEPWMDVVRNVAEPQGELDDDQICGTVEVRLADFLAAIPPNIDRFFLARHSVRHFAEGEVTDVEIDRAVALAIRTPSVCNRQSWRVHDYSGRQDVAKVLAHQNGNRGFGDTIARVLIVTSDLRTFSKPGERFQCWIDGGMFSMSLVYALQSLGVGTCTLNCSNEWRTDVALRKAAGIPTNEAVVMMIGVGRLREVYRVARSPRRHPRDIVVRHRLREV